MTRIKKRVTTGVLVVLILISGVVFASISFPNALVYFSGVTLTKNGTTTQCFVDVTLKNIETTGLSFCLQYDPGVVKLSKASDNAIIQNPPQTSLSRYSFDLKHEFFEQNKTAFPEGSFTDIQNEAFVGVYMPVIGIADPENGRLIMNFLPDYTNADKSTYIENKQVEGKPNPQARILANTKDGVKLGRISFQVVDPTEFVKKTPEELKEVIKVVPFRNMIEDAIVQGGDTGVNLSYLDENDDIRWYSRAEANIDYKFEISAELENVEPQVKELTVSSYEIYKQRADGEDHKQDLIDFINEKMSMLTLTYADGSTFPEQFEWKDCTITPGTYNPKGGDYEVKCKYNDDFELTVNVHITPVKLTGFELENKNLTYYYEPGGENTDFPSVFEQLELPKTARPVFDTYLPNGGLTGVNISSWYEPGGSSEIVDIPDNFTDGGIFTFDGRLDSQDETVEALNNCEWLTIDSMPDITAVRTVVTDKADMPKELEVTSASTDTSGVLHISVKYKDNDDGTANAIPDGTKFHIKMPGGELIDTDALGGRYIVTYETDGTVSISIQPDISNESEKKLAQVINLGGKAGEFEIASEEKKEDGSFKSISLYTPFRPETRRNTYIDAEYVFDYSAEHSAMFPVKSGTTLPNTVTLPMADHRIGTSYNGYNGTEPGSLATFTVEGWEVTGDTVTEGSVVMVVGKLANTAYTNYGNVYNDDDVYVTIKYLVSENDGEDSIDTIGPFMYDKRQEGYDYDELQNHSFTIKNTGAKDIYGLSAVISVSDYEGREAFVQTKDLPLILGVNESIPLDISTRIGLPAGDYHSTVTIFSNNKRLHTFNIYFQVTELPVYNIKITIDEDQKTFGSAKTQSETYSANANETITIIAEPEEDCEFVGWECVSGAVEFADSSKTPTTFTMPETDVEIKAVFKELVGAKLRASELYVRDTEDTVQQLYDDKWKTVEFDPVKREYYVAVDNNSDEDKNKVHLYFKLRTEAENAELSLTHKHGETTDTLAVPQKDEESGFYKTVDIPLDKSPVDNIITLTMEYDDPNDDPDEGLVTRYYKVHVFLKLKNSELMTFNYGNSPFGLIMSDDTIDKDTAKQSFKDNNNTFISDGVTPVGAKQQIGFEYTSKAWKTKNYDWDDTALFVINNEEFSDPGYSSVRNSIGQTVDKVSKKITVNRLSEPSLNYQDGSSNDFSSIVAETIALPDSGMITQLKDIRIRPDYYELVYSFTDFDGSVQTVAKPVIIINHIGNIDADKDVDDDDVTKILNRYKKYLADSTSVSDYIQGGLLNRYRIFDANRDGNVNAIDANYIRDGSLTQFYENTSEGGGG